MAEHEQLRILKWIALTTLVILVAGAAGLLISFDAWDGWRLLNEAPHWPRTDGVVVESYRVRRSESGPGPVRIIYTYEIGAHRYQGEAQTPFFMWFVTEDRVLARHPIGASVPIHYDPRNPDRSALGTWLSWNHSGIWVAFVVGVFLVSVCGLIVGGSILVFVVPALHAKRGRGSSDAAQAAVRRLRPRL